MKIKHNIILLVILSLFSNESISQTKEIIYPKGNWFFGGEIGLNAITSMHPSRMTSFQGGLFTEYYFANNWSATGRVKYFETGVLNHNDIAYGYFEGAVISVPLNLNWYYRIKKNFSGNLKLGIGFNQEIKSNYYYPPNEKTNYTKFYCSLNPGIGFNYFLSKNTAIYMNYEVFVLGNDRDDADFIEIVPNSPNNNLLNFGIKYSFKNK